MIVVHEPPIKEGNVGLLGPWYLSPLYHGSIHLIYQVNLGNKRPWENWWQGTL